MYTGGGSGSSPPPVTYHKYRVYGPRDHQLDNWDSWNFACFMTNGKLVTKGCTKQRRTFKDGFHWLKWNISGYFHRDFKNNIFVLHTLSAQFESRREQECLIKYINDEIDSTTMNKYAIGLHGTSDHGVFEWYQKEQGTPEAGTTNDPTLTFSNW